MVPRRAQGGNPRYCVCERCAAQELVETAGTRKEDRQGECMTQEAEESEGARRGAFAMVRHCCGDVAYLLSVQSKRMPLMRLVKIRSRTLKRVVLWAVPL